MKQLNILLTADILIDIYAKHHEIPTEIKETALKLQTLKLFDLFTINYFFALTLYVVLSAFVLDFSFLAPYEYTKLQIYGVIAVGIGFVIFNIVNRTKIELRLNMLDNCRRLKFNPIKEAQNFHVYFEKLSSYLEKNVNGCLFELHEMDMSDYFADVNEIIEGSEGILFSKVGEDEINEYYKVFLLKS